MINEKMSPTATQTKKNIMDAFWQLYKAGGISKVSVTRICSLAGYNRSTFYVYFQDIYEVLDEIEAMIITPEEFSSLVLSNILYENDKTKSIKMMLGLFENNCEYFPVLLGPNGDPAFREKLLEKLAPAVSSMLGLSLQANRKLKYIMEYQSSAVLTTIVKWYQYGKDISVDELISLLIDITTNGVQTELMKYYASVDKIMPVDPDLQA